jgi:hypothetical protein
MLRHLFLPSAPQTHPCHDHAAVEPYLPGLKQKIRPQRGIRTLYFPLWTLQFQRISQISPVFSSGTASPVGASHRRVCLQAIMSAAVKSKALRPCFTRVGVPSASTPSRMKSTTCTAGTGRLVIGGSPDLVFSSFRVTTQGYLGIQEALCQQMWISNITSTK